MAPARATAGRPMAARKAGNAADIVQAQRYIAHGVPVPVHLLDGNLRAVQLMEPAPPKRPTPFYRRYWYLVVGVLLVTLVGIGVGVYFGMKSAVQPPCGNGEVRVGSSCVQCGGGTLCASGRCQDQSRGGRCEECTVSADCGPGGLCVETAHNQGKACTQACTNSTDCATLTKINGREICDTNSGTATQGTCVQCASASDCKTMEGQSTPACQGGQCIYCGAANKSCDLEYHCNPTNNQCVKGCNMDDECPRGTLCTSGRVCMACNPQDASQSTCKAPTPRCSASGTCVECTTTADCVKPFVCKQGTCASPVEGGGQAFTLYVSSGSSEWKGTALSFGLVTKYPPKTRTATTKDWSRFSVHGLATPGFATPHSAASTLATSTTESMTPITQTLFVTPKSSSPSTTTFSLQAFDTSGAYYLVPTCLGAPDPLRPTLNSCPARSSLPDASSYASSNAGSTPLTFSNFAAVNAFAMWKTTDIGVSTPEEALEKAALVSFYAEGDTSTPLTGPFRSGSRVIIGVQATGATLFLSLGAPGFYYDTTAAFAAVFTLAAPVT